MHRSSSGCRHQITHGIGIYQVSFGNKAFHCVFYVLIMIPERCLNGLWHCSLLHVLRPWRIIAFGQGQCVGVDLCGGSLFRWLSQGAKSGVKPSCTCYHFQGGSVVHTRECADCKDIVTDCEGLWITLGMIWSLFGHFEIVTQDSSRT